MSSVHGAKHRSGISVVVESIAVVLDVGASVVALSGGQSIERSRFNSDIVVESCARTLMQGFDLKSANTKLIKPVSKSWSTCCSCESYIVTDFKFLVCLNKSPSIDTRGLCVDEKNNNSGNGCKSSAEIASKLAVEIRMPAKFSKKRSMFLGNAFIVTLSKYINPTWALSWPSMWSPYTAVNAFPLPDIVELKHE